MADVSVARLRIKNSIEDKGRVDLLDLEDVVKSLTHTPPHRNERH
jgi:hypothetical protein